MPCDLLTTVLAIQKTGAFTSKGANAGSNHKGPRTWKEEGESSSGTYGTFLPTCSTIWSSTTPNGLSSSSSTLHLDPSFWCAPGGVKDEEEEERGKLQAPPLPSKPSTSPVATTSFFSPLPPPTSSSTMNVHGRGEERCLGGGGEGCHLPPPIPLPQLYAPPVAGGELRLVLPSGYASPGQGGGTSEAGSPRGGAKAGGASGMPLVTSGTSTGKKRGMSPEEMSRGPFSSPSNTGIGMENTTTWSPSLASTTTHLMSGGGGGGGSPSWSKPNSSVPPSESPSSGPLTSAPPPPPAPRVVAGVRMNSMSTTSPVTATAQRGPLMAVGYQDGRVMVQHCDITHSVPPTRWQGPSPAPNGKTSPKWVTYTFTPAQLFQGTHAMTTTVEGRASLAAGSTGTGGMSSSQKKREQHTADPKFYLARSAPADDAMDQSAAAAVGPVKAVQIVAYGNFHFMLAIAYHQVVFITVETLLYPLTPLGHHDGGGSRFPFSSILSSSSSLLFRRGRVFLSTRYLQQSVQAGIISEMASHPHRGNDSNLAPAHAAGVTRPLSMRLRTVGHGALSSTSNHPSSSTNGTSDGSNGSGAGGGDGKKGATTTSRKGPPKSTSGGSSSNTTNAASGSSTSNAKDQSVTQVYTSMMSAARTAAIPIAIESLALSSCGRYIAISLTSPSLVVLLVKLPFLLFFFSTTAEGEEGVPEELASFCEPYPLFTSLPACLRELDTVGEGEGRRKVQKGGSSSFIVVDGVPTTSLALASPSPLPSSPHRSQQRTKSKGKKSDSRERNDNSDDSRGDRSLVSLKEKSRRSKEATLSTTRPAPPSFILPEEDHEAGDEEAVILAGEENGNDARRRRAEGEEGHPLLVEPEGLLSVCTYQCGALSYNLFHGKPVSSYSWSPSSSSYSLSPSSSFPAPLSPLSNTNSMLSPSFSTCGPSAVSHGWSRMAPGGGGALSPTSGKAMGLSNGVLHGYGMTVSESPGICSPTMPPLASYPSRGSPGVQPSTPSIGPHATLAPSTYRFVVREGSGWVQPSYYSSAVAVEKGGRGNAVGSSGGGGTWKGSLSSDAMSHSVGRASVIQTPPPSPPSSASPFPPSSCVFSECSFLHNPRGEPIQLLVVWINSTLYYRVPLQTPPISFEDRFIQMDLEEQAAELERKGGEGVELSSTVTIFEDQDTRTTMLPHTEGEGEAGMDRATPLPGSGKGGTLKDQKRNSLRSRRGSRRSTLTPPPSLAKGRPKGNPNKQNLSNSQTNASIPPKEPRKTGKGSTKSGGAGGKRAGKASAEDHAPYRSTKRSVLRVLDGVQRCHAVGVIQVLATTSPSVLSASATTSLLPPPHLLALGCVGGTVQVLGPRRVLGSVSVVPSSKEVPCGAEDAAGMYANGMISVVSLTFQALPRRPSSLEGGRDRASSNGTSFLPSPSVPFSSHLFPEAWPSRYGVGSASVDSHRTVLPHGTSTTISRPPSSCSSFFSVTSSDSSLDSGGRQRRGHFPKPRGKKGKRGSTSSTRGGMRAAPTTTTCTSPPKPVTGLLPPPPPSLPPTTLSSAALAPWRRLHLANNADFFQGLPFSTSRLHGVARGGGHSPARSTRDREGNTTGEEGRDDDELTRDDDEREKKSRPPSTSLLPRMQGNGLGGLGVHKPRTPDTEVLEEDEFVLACGVAVGSGNEQEEPGASEEVHIVAGTAITGIGSQPPLYGAASVFLSLHPHLSATGQAPTSSSSSGGGASMTAPLRCPPCFISGLPSPVTAAMVGDPFPFTLLFLDPYATTTLTTTTTTTTTNPIPTTTTTSEAGGGGPISQPHGENGHPNYPTSSHRPSPSLSSPAHDKTLPRMSHGGLAETLLPPLSGLTRASVQGAAGRKEADRSAGTSSFSSPSPRASDSSSSLGLSFSPEGDRAAFSDMQRMTLAPPSLSILNAGKGRGKSGWDPPGETTNQKKPPKPAPPSSASDTNPARRGEDRSRGSFATAGPPSVSRSTSPEEGERSHSPPLPHRNGGAEGRHGSRSSAADTPAGVHQRRGNGSGGGEKRGTSPEVSRTPRRASTNLRTTTAHGRVPSPLPYGGSPTQASPSSHAQYYGMTATHLAGGGGGGHTFSPMSRSHFSPTAGPGMGGGTASPMTTAGAAPFPLSSTATPSASVSLTIARQKGCHQCVVWDVRYNALLGSLPFALPLIGRTAIEEEKDPEEEGILGEPRRKRCHTIGSNGGAYGTCTTITIPLFTTGGGGGGGGLLRVPPPPSSSGVMTSLVGAATGRRLSLSGAPLAGMLGGGQSEIGSPLHALSHSFATTTQSPRSGGGGVVTLSVGRGSARRGQRGQESEGGSTNVATMNTAMSGTVRWQDQPSFSLSLPMGGGGAKALLRSGIHEEQHGRGFGSTFHGGGGGPDGGMGYGVPDSATMAAAIAAALKEHIPRLEMGRCWPIQHARRQYSAVFLRPSHASVMGVLSNTSLASATWSSTSPRDRRSSSGGSSALARPMASPTGGSSTMPWRSTSATTWSPWPLAFPYLPVPHHQKYAGHLLQVLESCPLNMGAGGFFWLQREVEEELPEEEEVEDEERKKHGAESTWNTSVGMHSSFQAQTPRKTTSSGHHPTTSPTSTAAAAAGAGAQGSIGSPRTAPLSPTSTAPNTTTEVVVEQHRADYHHAMYASSPSSASCMTLTTAGGGVTGPIRIRPYFWSFTSLLSCLYPSFLAYFPDVPLSQIAEVLHELPPSARTDSVALMNAAAAIMKAGGDLRGEGGGEYSGGTHRTNGLPGVLHGEALKVEAILRSLWKEDKHLWHGGGRGGRMQVGKPSRSTVSSPFSCASLVGSPVPSLGTPPNVPPSPSITPGAREDPEGSIHSRRPRTQKRRASQHGVHHLSSGGVESGVHSRRLSNTTSHKPSEEDDNEEEVQGPGKRRETEKYRGSMMPCAAMPAANRRTSVRSRRPSDTRPTTRVNPFRTNTGMRGMGSGVTSVIPISYVSSKVAMSLGTTAVNATDKSPLKWLSHFSQTVAERRVTRNKIFEDNFQLRPLEEEEKINEKKKI